jgi:GNAT superfamily N-acetyltransferase
MNGSQDLMSLESDEFFIRAARREDAPALWALLRSNRWHKRFETEPEQETLDAVARHLDQCLDSPSHSIFVASTPGGKIAGYAAVHWLPYLFLDRPEGFVSELFVDSSIQGKGLGTLLLDRTIEEAKERGCSRLQLINLKTRDSYKRGFYSKAGWTERPDAASFVIYLEQ